MASLKTDGKLKATITVGSGGGIGKKQLEEALSTKADINHIHEEYLTEHQSLEHLALKDHTHEEYLTEHQDISHLASTQYVNDSLKEKSDELILYANGVASMEARNAVGELRNELVNYATTTVLKYNGVDATDLNQEEFAMFIGDLRTELDELKSSMTSMVSAAEPISEYYVAYTIDKSVSTFSLRNNVEVTVGSGGYIPECSDGYEFVKITLLDGNLTTDLNTRISKVDSIKVYYPEKTTSIKFTDTKVKEVEYINLENVTDMTNMFQNCTSLESVELINTNNIVVDETTFEGVSEECAITVGKKWDKTEEESGFAGTFINPWKYYIEYTIQDDNNTYLDPFHIPTITSIENDYDESNYTQNFNSIDVYLKDGSIITDSLDGILVSDVERIIAYYSEETVSIKCPPSIKSVENINIEKLTQMHYMFTGCIYLTEIKELENWDVTNINTMEAMFANCISLTSLNLSNWNIDNVGNTIMMFSSCSSLQLLNLSTWNTNSIDIYENNMFEYISSDIDWCYDEADPNSYANFTLTEEQTGYAYTFPWNVYDNPYYIEYTISGSGSQTLESKPEYYIPQISVDGSTYTQEYDKIEITLNDDSITSDLNTLATDVKLIRAYYNENVIGMKVGTMTSNRFKSVNYIKTDNFTSLRFGSGQLTSLDLSNLNLSSLTSMNSMFSYCSKLEEIKGLDRLDTSKITNMGSMFQDCKLLTSLDISNFVTSNVTNMGSMFWNCNSLTSLNLSNWNISSVVTSFRGLSNMFYGCTSLISLNLSTWNTGNIHITGADNMLKNVPENIDWCYDGSNYQNWTLTEEQTGFSGTFPWNKQEEDNGVLVHISDPLDFYNFVRVTNYNGIEMDFQLNTGTRPEEYKDIIVPLNVLEECRERHTGLTFEICDDEGGKSTQVYLSYEEMEKTEYWVSCALGSIVNSEDEVDNTVIEVKINHYGFENTSSAYYASILTASYDQSFMIDFVEGNRVNEASYTLQAIAGRQLYISIEGVEYSIADASTVHEIWTLWGDPTIYTEKPIIPNYERIDAKIYYYKEGQEDYVNNNLIAIGYNSFPYTKNVYETSIEGKLFGYCKEPLYTNLTNKIIVYNSNWEVEAECDIIINDTSVNEIWIVYGDPQIYYENPFEEEVKTIPYTVYKRGINGGDRLIVSDGSGIIIEGSFGNEIEYRMDPVHGVVITNFSLEIPETTKKFSIVVSGSTYDTIITDPWRNVIFLDDNSNAYYFDFPYCDVYEGCWEDSAEQQIIYTVRLTESAIKLNATYKDISGTTRYYYFPHIENFSNKLSAKKIGIELVGERLSGRYLKITNINQLAQIQIDDVDFIRIYDKYGDNLNGLKLGYSNISDGLHSNCGITSVLYLNVPTVPADIFSGCVNLRTINLGNRANRLEIDELGFEYCEMLQTVTLGLDLRGSEDYPTTINTTGFKGTPENLIVFCDTSILQGNKSLGERIPIQLREFN